MTCAGAAGTFRLLDFRVGWDPADSTGLAGLDDPAGVTLAPIDPNAIGDDALTGYIPPPWLARGCSGCEWFMLTPRSRLLQLGGCACAWREQWAADCTPLLGTALTALAAAAGRLALADRAGGRIIVTGSDGPWVIADIPCTPAPYALAFDCCGTLLAAVQGDDQLRRFGPGGAPVAPFSAALPPGVLRIAATSDATVWAVAAGSVAGTFVLWRARPGDGAFSPAGLADLAGAMGSTGLFAARDDTVCLTRTGANGEPVTCCWSRFGVPVPPPPTPPPLVRYKTQGQLLTLPIDSGIPRCVWHRVQLDADRPVGTELSVAVATADTEWGTAQVAPSAGWPNFPPGVPHPLDWQELGANMDALIQQPPGRYLYVRLRFQSVDGTASPVVRRVRLDFPRVTSIDALPAIYRANVDAADFTSRFLALFDASIADLDNAIERAPALLDLAGVPDEVLPWLGSFVGLVFDPAWDPNRHRKILASLPQLYRQRGTPAGLRLAFKLVFDIEPAVEELGPERPWAALGQNSRLRGMRLFGRNRSRARIGRSLLGQSVVKSWGDPERDPVDALAWRVQVRIPPSGAKPPIPRLQALLDSQKPAHVFASLRVGGDMFLAGALSAVGIDTAFLPPPAPVLGLSGNVRLGRASVLRRGRCSGPAPCASFVVGQTITE
jgi:phage tail-like protein